MGVSVDKLAERLAACLREDPFISTDQLLAAAGSRYDPETLTAAIERARALVPGPRPRRKRKEKHT